MAALIKGREIPGSPGRKHTVPAFNSSADRTYPPPKRKVSFPECDVSPIGDRRVIRGTVPMCAGKKRDVTTRYCRDRAPCTDEPVADADVVNPASECSQ
jgi:hypothetical protein